MKQSPEDFRRSLEVAIEAAKRGPTPQELNDAPLIDRWQPCTDRKCVVICGIFAGVGDVGPGLIRTTAIVNIGKGWRWIRTIDAWYRLSSRSATPDDRSMVLLNDLKLPGMEQVDLTSARFISALFAGECMFALKSSSV